MEVFTLGEFKIIVNGRDISPKLKMSAKKLLLLQYLFVNREKGASTEMLTQIIWKDDTDSNPQNSLKTLVSRLRKELADMGLKNVITNRSGKYIWNVSPDHYIDIYRLSDLHAQLSGSTDLSPINRAMFEEALHIYRGELLDDSEIKEFVDQRAEYYKSLYVDTMKLYISLLAKNQLYDDIIRVSKATLSTASVELPLNMDMTLALMQKGNDDDAMVHYRNTVQLGSDYIGMESTEKMMNLYREIVRRGPNLKAVAEELQQKLEEHSEAGESGDKKGAYICDYSVFCDLYSMYRRSLQRINIPIFLATITIELDNESHTNPFDINELMRRLLENLKDNLRIGDVVSQYGLMQCTVMLPAVYEREVCEFIMERIKMSFYNEPQHRSFGFNYYLLKLDS